MLGQDRSDQLVERVRTAIADGQPLAPRGGGSKEFYGRAVDLPSLDVSSHRGIIRYEPADQIIHARAGTTLDDIERLLARQQQMLPFEPPRFGPGSTLGGMVAAGLAGPRRPYAGAIRDHILGVRIINGRGEILDFGSHQVKNQAGYDIPRLMVGSLGTLGVILSIALRVSPKPEQELTLVQEFNADHALTRLVRLGSQSLPLTASFWQAGQLYLRLSGHAAAIQAARQQIGGEALRQPGDIWSRLRDHSLAFFAEEGPLWRIALPPAAPTLSLDGHWLFEWHGQLRWLRDNGRAGRIRQAAAARGGHATLFRGDLGDIEIFQPLPEPLFAMHRNIKAALDPQHLFNPGRIYTDL